MTFPLDGYDVIHASPPCQAFTSLRTAWNAGEHPELVEPMRERLIEWGGPWVIENVPQSPLTVGPPSLFSDVSGVELCGTMFGLRTKKYELRRHRLFESNVPMVQPSCRHSERTVVGFYGDHVRIREVTTGEQRWGRDITGRADKLAYVAEFLDIHWMTWDEARLAIPPAYTEFVGSQLLQAIRAADSVR